MPTPGRRRHARRRHAHPLVRESMGPNVHPDQKPQSSCFCQNGKLARPQSHRKYLANRSKPFTFRDLQPRPLVTARALRNTAKSRGALPFLAAPRLPRIPIAGRISPRFPTITRHPERSEGSHPRHRFFATLRMTYVAHLMGGISRGSKTDVV